MQIQERTLAQWQTLMIQGEVSAVQLTEHFLARIAALDQAGPTLNAVIETNPDALEIAAALDAERKQRGSRGPLHGVPILVKDNIDSADAMMTTAGSLALSGNTAPRDAFVVTKLREAGAVLLGKTNLSEWSSFRSTHSRGGWSSRGGQTRNPYALDRTPHGSSSGSAVAVAANLCAAALGTETDGSIVYPASVTGIVGLKPTVGLLSCAGIIPISHSQDSVGPMARTVADAATLLSALVGFDARDPRAASKDYRHFLTPHGLRGARLGVARRYFPAHEKVDAITEDALEVLKHLGATLVDLADFGLNTDGLSVECELEVLLYEFKAGVGRYLAQHPRAKVKSLEEVIAFNRAHAERVMPYFQQELLELAQTKGNLKEAAYIAAHHERLRLARTEGIDKTLHEHHLDAIIAPTHAPAWAIDIDPVVGAKVTGGCALPAAMAGYPHITVPAGYAHDLPVGLSFFGAAFSEGHLMRYAYAFEQATQVRYAPTFAAHAEER